MLSQCPSQLYKAAFRGHEEDETYRCLSTFNFGNYSDTTRTPFGQLEILNEETLGPQQTKVFSVDDHRVLLLIPLVGTIAYKDDFDTKTHVNTEEIQLVTVPDGMVFQVQNPYENELINYLQIRLTISGTADYYATKKTFDFKTREKLFPLLENPDYAVFIGIFNSRSEGIYKVTQPGKGVFAFVINGAFEFQNRLLETRDGLAIWDIDEIEFESLTENAILLLIETTLQD